MGDNKMRRMRFMNVSIILLVLLAGIASASETARAGGGGGTRSVIMDCGSNAFIVGVSALGGKDGQFGFNLVRKINFICQAFNGTTPTGSTTPTVEAAGSKPALFSVSADSRNCPDGSVVKIVETLAGSFIDRLDGFSCNNASGPSGEVPMNIGGDGGSRVSLLCPSQEALFKVEARVGDTIDSLKGFCRPFVSSPPTQPVREQILATVTPVPSLSNRVKVGLKSSVSFQFTISNAVVSPEINVGISGETDLLGGGALNPPEFRLELINPSGTVVASKSVKNARSTIQSVKFGFNVNGTWKLKVTNLKEGIGALDIISFNAFQ